MDHALESLVFRHLAERGPTTAAELAVAAGLEMATIERIIVTLIGAGLIGVTGHEPDGTPIFDVFQA